MAQQTFKALRPSLMRRVTKRARLQNLRAATGTLWRALVLLVGALGVAGCERDTKPAPSPAADAGGQSARAVVPLRVWFAGDEANQAIFQRQWQAASERPLELRMLTSDELLSADKCDSDVVIYPAHLIGDLLARQWLVELPSGLAPTSLAAAGSSLNATESSNAPSAPSATASQSRASAAAMAGEEEVAALQPAAWIDQTRYGRSLWGLSLGATTPVTLSNFELALPEADAAQHPSDQDARAYWQRAIDALSQQTSGKENEHAALAEADPSAVCDRFMLVLTSMSRRESRLGALLDPETLEARLDEPEFVRAAEILLQLHRLNASPQAMAGSYGAAWEALAGDDPALSIGVPPLPTPEVDPVTSIAINLPPLSPASSGGRSAGSERTRGWNSGHGLVASLTTQCRQTSLAIEFLRWLGSEANRNALARSVDGISAQAVYAPGSSAWQAQRLGQRLAQQPRLPNQPRLPGSAEYRRALGEQLVRMLAGEQDPEAALKAAAAAWDEITNQRQPRDLRASYEASLGL